MAAMSDYLEVEIRKHIFRTGSFTKPTVLAVALCTVATTDADTGATITEIPAGRGYTRATLNPLDANWSAPDGTAGQTKNQAILSFGTVSGSDWPAVTHCAILDSATLGAGNVLFHGAVTLAKTPVVGDPATFPVDTFVVTIDN